MKYILLGKPSVQFWSNFKEFLPKHWKDKRYEQDTLLILCWQFKFFISDVRKTKSKYPRILNPNTSDRSLKTYRVFQKKWCSVYFANISATKYRIFKLFFSPENWDPYAKFEYQSFSGQFNESEMFAE